MKMFKKINVTDQNLNLIQDQIAQILDPLTKNPLSDAVFLNDVTLIGGVQNLVPHKLARSPIFWVVTRKNANTNVWEDESDFPEKYLILRTSTNCRISLMVG